MKYMLLLLIMMSLNAAPLYQQDDKQKHFVGCAMIGSTATGLAKYYGRNTFEAIMIGVATSVLVGVAKEATDEHSDMNDVYTDTLGGVAGSVISAQFSWEL